MASLFLVDGDAAGLTRQGYPTQDGLRAADLTLDPVRVGRALIGPRRRRLAGDRAGRRRSHRALCAEAVGVMATTQALTLDYLKTREQFGATIGAVPGAAAPRRRTCSSSSSSPVR